MQEEVFHGAIVAEPSVKDYIAGGETGITVIRSITDQSPYLPDPEGQRDNVTDMLDCVTFSAIHDIEMGMNYLLATSQVPAVTLAFLTTNGYLQNGKFKASVRFSAKVDGTTTAGNDSKTVADAVSSGASGFGLVPDSLWPMSPSMTWDEYYADIPQNLLDLGKQFKNYVTIQYQYALPTTVNLLVAPVQIFTAVCPGWNTANPVNTCTLPCQHATLVYGLDASGDYLIRDHYDPYNKVLSKDYKIYYSQQFVVTTPEPTAPAPAPFHYVFSTQLTYGMGQTPEVMNLQRALQEIIQPSTGKPYMTPGVFGPYGPQTKAALGAFQTDHNISDPNGQGADFGPQTRAAVNSLI